MLARFWRWSALAFSVLLLPFVFSDVSPAQTHAAPAQPQPVAGVSPTCLSLSIGAASAPIAEDAPNPQRASQPAQCLLYRRGQRRRMEVRRLWHDLGPDL